MESNTKRYFKAELFEFIRFNLVGIVNTGLTYLIFSLAYYFSESNTLSLLLDYAFGMTFSFLVNRSFTFRQKDHPVHWRQLAKMVGSYIILMVVNWLILNVLTLYLNWNPYIAQLLALAVIVICSFLVQKLIVFKK